ncbi:MAG: hypothetical protein ACRD0C_02475 [Acidimicrobiia bacterium]
MEGRPGGMWVLFAALSLLAATLLPPAVGASTGDTATDPCPGLEAIILPSGAVTCTHGPDPLEGLVGPHPHGGDDAEHSDSDLLPADPDGPGTHAPVPDSVPCFGDGRDGNRVQAIYAVPSDRPERYEDTVDDIRRWAAQTDSVFVSSAALYGETRHVRFVTDSRCRLVVERVVLSPAADDNFRATVLELAARGYHRPDRRYLVWMDSDVLCGIGQLHRDERSTGNLNDGAGAGLVARVDTRCWGLLELMGTSVEAHELVHTLGGVNPTAPHATPLGHCTDDGDVMCYQDAPLTKLAEVCPPEGDALLDCNGDDYFNPTPAAGSYLDTHWNVADSSFLSAAEGRPGRSFSAG